MDDGGFVVREVGRREDDNKTGIEAIICIFFFYVAGLKGNYVTGSSELLSIAGASKRA